MKKIFTLLAVAAMAITVQAADIYSWASAGADAVTETGGVATYENGGEPSRLNYQNGEYWTICLNGKKANMGESPASNNAGYIQIVLNEPLAAGDNIELYGYINKDNADAVANAYIRFMNEAGEMAADFNETDGYPNINPDGGAQQPGTHVIPVPAEAAGCKTIQMTRNKANTNVFIITAKVTRGGESGLDIVETENAPAVYYNLQGMKVENPTAGLYICKQGNKVTKVIL